MRQLTKDEADRFIDYEEDVTADVSLAPELNQGGTVKVTKPK